MCLLLQEVRQKRNEMVEKTEGTHDHGLHFTSKPLDAPENFAQIHHNEENVVENDHEHDPDNRIEPLEEGKPFDHRTKD